MRANPRRRAGAFTLIEILVVCGVIAILAALLFPAFAKARSRGGEAACTSNLSQIGKAFQMYLDDHDGLRARRLQWLVPSHLAPQLLVCPNDPEPAGWGNVLWHNEYAGEPAWPHPESYGYFWCVADHDDLWELAQLADGSPGYVICPVHGTPLDVPTQPAFYNGRILRLCFDGSVRLRILDPGRQGFNFWKALTDDEDTDVTRREAGL